jgi:hypothetical protein
MTPWKRLRASLERIDFRPDELARKSARALDDDRYLDGRPFLIAEGSAEKVAFAVEAFATADSETAVEKIARGQIAHLDAELADGVELGDDAEPSSEHAYRDELLGALTKIHELSRLALPDELPWRAVSMHACAAPFWTGRDVDGLETVCRAANVPSPDCLNPAWRVFSEACDAFPTLRERLGVELKLPHDVGAFVAPGEIDRLLLFLTEYGARIISAAARGGEGPAATALLRKIRECAVYAGRHGYGYLEASGIAPVPATKPDAHAH